MVTVAITLLDNLRSFLTRNIYPCHHSDLIRNIQTLIIAAVNAIVCTIKKKRTAVHTCCSPCRTDDGPVVTVY